MTKIHLQNVRLDVTDEYADKLVAVFKHLRSCPEWLPRPNAPGWWLLVWQNKTGESLKHVTQEMLDTGAPYYVEAALGPLPERP